MLLDLLTKDESAVRLNLPTTNIENMKVKDKNAVGLDLPSWNIDNMKVKNSVGLMFPTREIDWDSMEPQLDLSNDGEGDVWEKSFLDQFG